MATKKKSHTRLHNIGICSALALGVFLSGTSQAASEKITVSYTNTDLSSPAGVSDLYNRIEKRIKLYCTGDGVRGLRQRMQERQCAENMLESAIRKIDNPNLTALHGGKPNRESAVAP